MTYIPDFTPLLKQLSGRALDGPSPEARPPPLERPAAMAWPQIDEAVARLAGLYPINPKVVAPLQVLAGAQLLKPDEIRTAPGAWEYQGLLPFLPDQAGESAARFAVLDVEVLSGCIGVAVLSADGADFASARHFLQPGRHKVQLAIQTPLARGIVFCNGAVASDTAHFRVQVAAVAHLDKAGPAAPALHLLLEEDEGRPQPEVDAPHNVRVCTELVFHHLLARNEVHAAARLVRAIEEIQGRAPAWINPRLRELVGLCHGVPVPKPGGTDLPTPVRPAREPDQSASFGLEVFLGELFFLREATRGAAIIPLHLELLEAMAWLDLVAAAEGVVFRFSWQREALATTPVPRGVLQALLAVILERLRGTSFAIEVVARSDQTGTRIHVRSPLGNGALQYQEYSTAVALLHTALNLAGGVRPRIVHALGGEKELSLHWPGPLEPARQPAIDLTPAPVTAVIYDRGDGHVIRLARGICYKLAPARTSKRNNLVDEAALLHRLAPHDFIPKVLAAHAGPTGTAMSYCHEPGETLSAWAASSPAHPERVRTLLALTESIVALNDSAIRHRDLRAENVLRRPDGGVCVLDFDQAGPADGADDFGNEWAGADACAGFGGMLQQLDWIPNYLRTAGQLGFAWKLGRLSSANSPGRHSCYYAWRWGGLLLEGERPWPLRWGQLQRIFSALPPGAFLELGCNLGLLSTHVAMLGWRAEGVDQNALVIAAADLVTCALGTTAKFRTGNLTAPALFAELDRRYDLVAVLSVIHWLSDPAPMENFLRQQPRLLFEGHRSLAEEEAYLRQLGFPRIELIGYSERLRPLLYAVQE